MADTVQPVFNNFLAKKQVVLKEMLYPEKP